jgi:hypothetical protein
MRYSSVYIHVCLFCFAVLPCSAGTNDTAIVYKKPMYFTENRGQWQPEVRYAMLGSRGAAWMRADGISITYLAERDVIPFEHPGPAERREFLEEAHIRFLNASPEMRLEVLDGVGAKSNFYRGGEAPVEVAGARNFRRVRYQNVWHGVSVEYTGNERGLLSQRVYLAPGAVFRPSNLFIHAPGIDVTPGPTPHADSQEVTTSARMDQQQILNTSCHDTLCYSTEYNTCFLFTGTSPMGIAISGNGYVTVCAATLDPRLPVRNAIQSQIRGISDMMVLRFDSTGQDLVFCTYLGGDGLEQRVGAGWYGKSLAHGARIGTLNGDTYLCFPASRGAPLRSTSYQAFPTYSGFNLDFAAYICALHDNGTLKGATYLGGPGLLEPIALNVSVFGVTLLGGNVFGRIRTTANALLAEKGCDSCAASVLARVSLGLDTLLFLTFLHSADDSTSDSQIINFRLSSGRTHGVAHDGSTIVTWGLHPSAGSLDIPGLGRGAFDGIWLSRVSADAQRVLYSRIIDSTHVPGYLSPHLECPVITDLQIDANNGIRLFGRSVVSLNEGAVMPAKWLDRSIFSTTGNGDYSMGPGNFGLWAMSIDAEGNTVSGSYYGRMNGVPPLWGHVARNPTCGGYSLIWHNRDPYDQLHSMHSPCPDPQRGMENFIVDLNEDLSVRYAMKAAHDYLPWFPYNGDWTYHAIDHNGYVYYYGDKRQGAVTKYHNAWRTTVNRGDEGYLVRFRLFTPCWQVGCGIASIDTLRIDREERYAEPREFDVDFAVTNHSPEKGARVLHALIEVPPGCALSRGLPSQPMIPATLSSGQTAHCSWTLRVTNPALVQDTIVVRCRVFYIDPESGQTYPPGEELCEHDIHVVKSSGYDPRLRCMVEGPDSLHWTGAGYAARAGDAPGAIRYTITYTNISTDTVAVARFEQTAGDHCLIVANASRQGGRIAPGEVVSFPVDVRVNSLRYNRAITVRTVALDDYDMPWTACEKSSVAPGIPHLPCDANGPVSITWNVATGTSTPPEPEFNLELSNPLDTIRMGLRTWLDLASASHLSALAGDSLSRGPVFINPAFRRTLSWKLRVNPPPSADTRDTLYFRYECDGLEQYCMLVVDIIVIDQTVLCSIAAPQVLTEQQLENHENVQLDYTLSNIGTVPVGVSRVDLAISPTSGVLALDALSQSGSTIAANSDIARQWHLRPLVLRQPRTAHFDVTAYGAADSVLSVCSHDMHIPGIDGLLCDITAVDTVRFIRDELRYDPDPVPVTMDLRNILDTPETSIEAEIDLTAAPRFELASGETAIKTLASLDSNSAAQLLWLLHPLADTLTEEQHITIRYRSTEQGEWKECTTSIIVEEWPPVKTTHCVVSGHDSLHADQAYERIIPEPFEISYSATNTGTVALHNCSATIVLPPEFELVSDSATLSFGSLRPGDSNTRWWTLKTTSALAGYGAIPCELHLDKRRAGQHHRLRSHRAYTAGRTDGIVFTPLHLHFEAVKDAALPAAQYIQLWTGGGFSMPWTAQGGQWWLNADPVSGDHAARIAVQPNSTALPLGLHGTALTIAGQAPNLPKDVAVTYRIKGLLDVGRRVAARLYGLGSVWPQPVPLNGEARVSINVPAGEYVRIVLYDALGRELAVVKEGAMPEVNPVLRIMPSALRLRAGMYFIRMIGAWGVETPGRASVRAVVVR